MRVMFYCRCSPGNKGKGATKYSLLAQRESCMRWIRQWNQIVIEPFFRGWPSPATLDPEDVFVDVCSPKIDALNRPGLGRLVRSVSHGCIVLAASRDVLFRDQHKMLGIERYFRSQGVWFNCEVDTLAPLVEPIRPDSYACRADAAHQWEASLISVRTRAALAARKAMGKRCGEEPYGWRANANGDLVEVPAEQAAIRRAVELHASGMPKTRITRALQAEGHPPRGSRWHPTSVTRLLAAAAERAAKAAAKLAEDQGTSAMAG